MKTHYLKIEQKYLNEVIAKRKTFEVRKNDRVFQVDDVVFLCAYCPKSKQYLYKAVKVLITYILNDFEVLKDYCVFSFIISPIVWQDEKDSLMEISTTLEAHSFPLW